jgi:transposase InsO family protein
MSAAARCCGPWFSPLGTWERVALADVREQLRLAFTHWGLPGRFRVDNGWPWGSRGDYPTELSLWLIGLGIAMHWNNPRRPQENGVVERSQGTSTRWCEPWTCASPGELQARLERMDRLYREVYPYRGRQSRLAVFPGLMHSGRPYDRAAETAQWAWSRVAEHLAGIVVQRRVDQSGRVSLYNRGEYVGRLHQGTNVYVTYDPDRNDWVFAARDGRQLNRRPADQLSPERVMSLNVARHR